MKDIKIYSFLELTSKHWAPPDSSACAQASVILLHYYRVVRRHLLWINNEGLHDALPAASVMHYHWQIHITSLIFLLLYSSTCWDLPPLSCYQECPSLYPMSTSASLLFVSHCAVTEDLLLVSLQHVIPWQIFQTLVSPPISFASYTYLPWQRARKLIMCIKWAFTSMWVVWLDGINGR
jgi:hypothetical protein